LDRLQFSKLCESKDRIDIDFDDLFIPFECLAGQVRFDCIQPALKVFRNRLFRDFNIGPIINRFQKLVQFGLRLFPGSKATNPSIRFSRLAIL